MGKNHGLDSSNITTIAEPRKVASNTPNIQKRYILSLEPIFYITIVVPKSKPKLNQKEKRIPF